MKTIAMLALIALGGCYSTTVRSGRPVGQAPAEADSKWHHGYLTGTQEGSGPYDLNKMCPEGWAEITTHTSFANGLLEILTLRLYSPQTVDVKCAAPEAGEETAAR